METVEVGMEAGPPLDMAALRLAFERGLEWFLAHSDDISPDSKMAALGGLILIDPQRIPAAREVVEPRERPNPVAFLFGLVERSPLPVAWDDLDVFRRSPLRPSHRRYELYAINGAACQAAQAQSSMGQVEEPVLSWMRRNDLGGYNLAHQLLSWVLCVKNGHRLDEARERVSCLAPWLMRELDLYPFLYDDLFAESIAFLALAGVPVRWLTGHFHRLLRLQDPQDGKWRYTREPAELMWVVENAHLGRSPLLRLGAIQQPYYETRDPLEEFRRLENFHHGHATGLTLWALGICLREAHQRATSSAAQKTSPAG
jgi:hypothetical protein